MCSDLSTPAMLAALSHFVFRRGLPSKIVSYNGTNFVGAARELTDCYKLLHSEDFQNKAAELSTLKPIEWRFSPARAPHFGGLWEAGVRAMKETLRKILPPHLLTFEEMSTVANVVAVLNSRPFLPLDGHHQDGVSPLTAGHFQIGRPLKSIPTTTIEDQPLPLHRRWKLAELLQQQIWRSWRAAYLQSMNIFSKWRQSHPNLKEGDVVILRDETLVRRSWPLGLIVKTYPGSDGRVRVVEVRCRTTIHR